MHATVFVVALRRGKPAKSIEIEHLTMEELNASAGALPGPAKPVDALGPALRTEPLKMLPLFTPKPVVEAVPTPPAPQAEPPKRWTKRRRLLVASAAVALLVGGGLYGRWTAPPAGPSTEEVDATIRSALEDAAQQAASAPPIGPQVFQAIAPSIVVIEVDGVPGSQGAQGFGTGVVASAEGTILTAYHVIADADVVTVTFADGTRTEAQVTESDPETDIAVLTPDQLPEVIVPAVIGGGVQVGDEVFAVGHPFGMVASFSSGVVSGLDRSLDTPSDIRLEGLIQFDASVNPGNSGGPLLNSAAQVVGIVTAIANPSGQGFFVGLGFAVPIATAGGAAGRPPV